MLGSILYWFTFPWRPEVHSETQEVLNVLKLTQRGCGIYRNRYVLISNDRGCSESIFGVSLH